MCSLSAGAATTSCNYGLLLDKNGECHSSDLCTGAIDLANGFCCLDSAALTCASPAPGQSTSCQDTSYLMPSSANPNVGTCTMCGLDSGFVKSVNGETCLEPLPTTFGTGSNAVTTVYCGGDVSQTVFNPDKSNQCACSGNYWYNKDTQLCWSTYYTYDSNKYDPTVFSQPVLPNPSPRMWVAQSCRTLCAAQGFMAFFFFFDSRPTICSRPTWSVAATDAGALGLPCPRSRFQWKTRLRWMAWARQWVWMSPTAGATQLGQPQVSRWSRPACRLSHCL